MGLRNARIPEGGGWCHGVCAAPRGQCAGVCGAGAAPCIAPFKPPQLNLLHDQTSHPRTCLLTCVKARWSDWKWLQGCTFARVEGAVLHLVVGPAAEVASSVNNPGPHLTALAGSPWAGLSSHRLLRKRRRNACGNSCLAGFAGGRASPHVRGGRSSDERMTAADRVRLNSLKLFVLLFSRFARIAAARAQK